MSEVFLGRKKYRLNNRKYLILYLLISYNIILKERNEILLNIVLFYTKRNMYNVHRSGQDYRKYVINHVKLN